MGGPELGGGPWPPRTFLGCQPQGLYPNSQQDCQGAPVQTLATTSAHPGGRGGWFPGDPPAWGYSSCPLCFPQTLLGPAEPQFSPSGGVPSILSWGFLRSPPPPSNQRDQQRAPPSSCPPLPAPLVGERGRPLPATCLPARPPLCPGTVAFMST